MRYNKFLFWLFSLAPSRLSRLVLRLILWKEGGQMYSPTIREIYKKKYQISIGYGSYGGCFAAENIPPLVTFGNYCSIAKNVRIFRANHPKEKFTMHPLLYSPLAGHVKYDLLERPPLNIGNDVWIGEGSIILPSVRNVGNGAVIGAGSIVTKDVPAYTIVAGNPATKIGERFNREIIEKLEETKWWLLSKEDLADQIDNYNNIIFSYAKNE